MPKWEDLKKIEGTIIQIQIEQPDQQADLVFAIQPKDGGNPSYFANPFNGEPVIRAQLDLLRDALANNKTVRIAYEENGKDQASTMYSVRIHAH